MGYEVKRFRCDHGRREYDNKTFQLVLAARGTTYKPCPPYAHHKNGVAERMIQTITEKARSMMIDYQAPLVFWGEAVNTAVYFHQRTTNKGLTKRDDRDGYHAPYPTPYKILQASGKPSHNIIAMKSRTKLLSTTFGDSAATPVDLSPSRNAMENSAQDPSHV
jgi:hypothetical protein